MRNITLLWAIATGLIVVLQTELAWWHPACNIHDDGTIDFGYGFPFPYWTYVIAQATSAGFSVMPHVFVLNVLILAAIAYLFYSPLFQRLVDWKASIGTSLLTAGLVICLVELAPIYIPRAEFYPVRSIARGTPNSENYFSFRPALLAAWEGKRACPA